MMALSYAAGLEMVLDAARVNRKFRQTRWEVLYDAVGGIVAEDIASPKSSPEYDTSAMDGYAICSQVTADAAPERPVMFTVQGTLAAGDDPTEVVRKIERDQAINNLYQCVEIMTGATFPYAYDACVKVEDAVLVESPEAKYILVTRPVPRNAHRRLARSDISEGDVMIRQGQVLQASHVLSLASVGIKSVPLTTSPRVAVWSTGKEMAIGTGATGDANGPYLTAALKEMGLQADFLGVLDDDKDSLQKNIHAVADAASFDVVITSGAVSKGKFDHIRAVLEEIGADIVFHGLGIRPGHPVLFALISGRNGKTPFFGLPGNPGAAAACFRFLAVPYLRNLQGRTKEQPIMARLVRQELTSKPKHGCSAMPNTDCFRHGLLSTSATGQLIVEPSPDQSPAKLGQFTATNCWIHLRPNDMDAKSNPIGMDVVECYPISPTGAIHLLATRLN